MTTFAKRRVYGIACLLACSLAARLTVAAPAPVLSAQKDASGVTLKMATGLLRLEVFSDRTIHVTCSPTDKLPDKKEFVVNRKWTPVPFEWREEQGRFERCSWWLSLTPCPRFRPPVRRAVSCR